MLQVCTYSRSTITFPINECRLRNPNRSPSICHQNHMPNSSFVNVHATLTIVQQAIYYTNNYKKGKTYLMQGQSSPNAPGKYRIFGPGADHPYPCFHGFFLHSEGL